MANKITVKFEAQGAKALKTVIDNLSKSQTNLGLSQKKTNDSGKKLSKGMTDITNKGRLLNNSFATIRSKLLLMSFGFGLVSMSIGKALKMFGEQERAVFKLNNALGFNSTLLQSQASALQKVTGDGDETIINAQSILATFVRNEQAVSELTESTLNLSTALGIDLNSAANLIGKTIGSATNSLTRYGVSVTGAANSTERINSLIKNVNILFGDMAEAAGAGTLGSVEKLGASLGDLVERLGETLVSMGAVQVIELLSFSFEKLNSAIEFSSKILNLSKEQLDDEVTGRKAVAQAMNKQRQEIQSLTEAEDVNKKISEIKSLISSEESRIQSMNNLNQATKQASVQAAAMASNNSNLVESNEQFKILFEDNKGIFNENAEGLKEYNLLGNELVEVIEEAGDSFQALNILTDENANLGANMIQLDVEKITTTSELIELFTLLTIAESKLEEVRESSARKELIREAAKDKMINRNIRNAGRIAKTLTDNAEALANIEYGLAVIDAIRSGLTWRKQLIVAGIPAPLAATAGFLETSAGMIVASKIRMQEFEQGGLVGGRRHAQGGTMIEAERGEFVMSRDAVDSIGVNNLQAMNSGRGGASIVINNPIISSEFVESELPELISEAVRKGADFGMS